MVAHRLNRNSHVVLNDGLRSGRVSNVEGARLIADEAEEIGDAVAWRCSAESSVITGGSLIIDGDSSFIGEIRRLR